MRRRALDDPDIERLFLRRSRHRPGDADRLGRGERQIDVADPGALAVDGAAVGIEIKALAIGHLPGGDVFLSKGIEFSLNASLLPRLRPQQRHTAGTDPGAEDRPGPAEAARRCLPAPTNATCAAHGLVTRSGIITANRMACLNARLCRR
jgi:hypothetical protein